MAFAWDVLGPPTAVVARGTLTETGVDEQVALILTYPSGAQAVLSTALSSPGATRAQVHGTAGRIELDGDFYRWVGWTAYDAGGAAVERFEPQPEGRGMQFQALELERMVAAGERSNAVQPLAQSVAIMALLDDVRRQIGVRYPGEPPRTGTGPPPRRE